jgi:hypothetical protein
LRYEHRQIKVPDRGQIWIYLSLVACTGELS